MAETQQPMQWTSCFGNVRSLVLLNPKFLFANYTIITITRVASLFFEESDYKCITGTSGIPQNSLRSFDIAVLVKSCWECFCGQVLDRWPYQTHGQNTNTMHALFTSLYGVDPSVGGANFFTYKKFCDNSNHFKHYGQQCLYTQCTRCTLNVAIMRNALCVQVLVSAEVFFKFLFARLHSHQY